jgi:hypothetical protein
MKMRVAVTPLQDHPGGIEVTDLVLLKIETESTTIFARVPANLLLEMIDDYQERRRAASDPELLRALDADDPGPVPERV